MSSLPGRGGIFISYRREETAAQAGRLYDHLSKYFGEDRVFMDIDSIAIGADFTKAIIEYRLTDLSSMIGSNVTIRINKSWGALKGITLRIGDQVIDCGV